MQLRLALVGIVVSDMAASLAFYRRLGLALPEGAEGEPHVEVEVGGIRFAFDTEDVVRSFDPGWTPPSQGGQRQSLAFECASPTEVDAAYTDLTGAGYDGHLPPWDAPWGQRYAVVRDPDGNPVDLFASSTGG